MNRRPLLLGLALSLALWALIALAATAVLADGGADDQREEAARNQAAQTGTSGQISGSKLWDILRSSPFAPGSRKWNQQKLEESRQGKNDNSKDAAAAGRNAAEKSKGGLDARQ